MSSGSPTKVSIPNFIEQGFRWARESVELMHTNHCHPLPMTALIFMYAETLGKPIAENSSTEAKVCSFVKGFLPGLWAAFSWSNERRKILSDHYRNGLAHQIFMKKGAGIHEDTSGDTQYVSRNFSGIPYSINIDRLVPEFIRGLNAYYQRLENDGAFLNRFIAELTK